MRTRSRGRLDSNAAVLARASLRPIARKEWPLLQAAVVPYVALVAGGVGLISHPDRLLARDRLRRRRARLVGAPLRPQGADLPRSRRAAARRSSNASFGLVHRAAEGVRQPLSGYIPGMPFGLGIWEILILAGILVLLFGAKGAPGMARRLGSRRQGDEGRRHGDGSPLDPRSEGQACRAPQRQLEASKAVPVAAAPAAAAAPSLWLPRLRAPEPAAEPSRRSPRANPPAS